MKYPVKAVREGFCKMSYEIKTISDPSRIESGNVADVNVYNWGGSYRPETNAVLCYVKDRGFAVRLFCREKDPLATHTEPNSRVYEDSCLEFFANFRPDLKGSGYVNFEGNTNGAMLCFYGSSREDGERTSILGLGLPHPKPEVFRTDGGWGWRLLIPLDFIRAIYGSAEYRAGSLIRGNFFKCGDKTAAPHYGSYTKIESPYPNFHRPEYFADMIITGR